ncbi:RusA family crossover junction endodeoxyribonuclease [Patiriisocius sp. Uisw_017]|uniref:RusA family crossover junction endodeoxyribonuclease n=1 Tax=Patiriisocius sp. Uisw_017 TaxID=3230968 RepID=UPI0039E89623
MLPFEFIIEGPPVSLKTKNRARLRQWKADVASAATLKLPANSAPTQIEVEIKITYFYEGSTPDVDNIIKPIQDALVGLVYVDDDQVTETGSRKKEINGAYKIRGASSVIVEGFVRGNEFLHIKVIEHQPNQDLD